MADLTMCDRKDCPSCDKCYRFMAEPNPYRQSYFAPPYEPIKDDRCEYFIPVRPDGQKKSLDSPDD